MNEMVDGLMDTHICIDTNQSLTVRMASSNSCNKSTILNNMLHLVIDEHLNIVCIVTIT